MKKGGFVKKKLSYFLLRLGLIVTILSLTFGAGRVWAQTMKDLGSTDSGLAPTATPSSDPSAGGANTDTPGFTPPFSDTLPNSGSAPDENAAPGSPHAPGANYSYYMVSGSVMKGRSSSQTYTYYTTGCIYGVLSDFVVTDIQIPNGSVIKYLTLYYRDTNVSANAIGYLTYYAPGQSSVDAVYVNSSGSSGFGTAISQEITVTVDNSSFAYTLLGNTGTNDTTVQLCGLRVTYYAPQNPLIFLPMITR